MKVTHVAIRPTERAVATGSPSLTPELLAATGARYSRNNEGLEAILSKIDPSNLDRSVDSIFRMIDYGHQSIADMAPVAMFIDGISIWLAYYMWAASPTASGQESSTRYIRFSGDELMPPEQLGIDGSDRDEWTMLMQHCFHAFESAFKMWEDLVAQCPHLARIPRSLLDDASDRAMKQVTRMKRNYAFDRARYLLPAAVSTNVMLVMSARGWVQLCQNLLSHALPEARNVGEAIRAELELSAPRMLKHATKKDSIEQGLEQEFEALVSMARQAETYEDRDERASFDQPAVPSIEVTLPDDVRPEELAKAIQFHDNRYAWIGQQLRRTVVRFGWTAVAFAEIRDLTRHRTGTKYCPMCPLGFYAALDQVPNDLPQAENLRHQLHHASDAGRRASNAALAGLQCGDPGYIYRTVLGTQYRFEHVTTADKFIYEAELRTGTGAHFRYAKHLHDVLTLWYERFPGTKDYILEGSAEPE